MSENIIKKNFTPQCPHLAWMVEHLDGWQFGEQGLIPAILKALRLSSGLFIEFGAGDGVSLPITIAEMYRQDPLACVLVEIDESRRESLRSLYPLATILKTLNWDTKYIDESNVVVIDIDGSDSVVMREMLQAGVRPALLVVEHFDRHYPIATSFPDPIPQWMLGIKLESGHAIQDTAETLHAIAGKFGYERIGFNRCNSFFVRRELFTALFR
jgi:hypothetical protein